MRIRLFALLALLAAFAGSVATADAYTCTQTCYGSGGYRSCTTNCY